MITVVFDTNTIVSAIFWPKSPSRRCLAGLARRLYGIAVSGGVFDEYESVAAEFQPRFPSCNSAGALAWLRLKARWVEPALLENSAAATRMMIPFSRVPWPRAQNTWSRATRIFLSWASPSGSK